MDSLIEKWQRLKNVVESVETQLGKDLQRVHGLGLSDYRALSLLAKASDSELRMQELAKNLGLNQSSVTRLVERLEKAGYTIRDLCPKDKRGVYSVITEQGKSVQQKAEADYKTFFLSALENAAAVKGDEEVVEGLLSMLKQ